MKSDDLVSVGDVIDALVYKGQCSKRYKWGESWELNMSEILDALKDVPPANAPKAVPNVPGALPVYAVSADDVIENMESELELCNRVLDELDITGTEREIHSRVAEMLREQIDFVKGLPQVEPEPRKGKWIGKYLVTSVCSECNYLIHDSKVKVFAYCPNCGAKMEEK